jgi:predicted RND superfamily exporter protein
LDRKAANHLQRRDRVPRALTAVGLRFPRTTIIIWLVVALLAGTGIAKLRIETSTDSVLDRSGPAWAFYQQSQDRFGGDEIISILIGADKPFERETLNEVVRLTDIFQALAFQNRTGFSESSRKKFARIELLREP